ncbi:radical SAM/SPASM domain-containing protein [Sporosalibacterium faouarense]|uniref:radical SAM/SPASM domain-containing protein n=1 Tax=Sporosalibacterium faouarense TaxID=516123 RepID=UPI00141C3BB6|nr:radical SAM protein [Sporosalibacterium faouarense]MTI49648.1 radical SAM protein [Bacillota bacterium]
MVEYTNSPEVVSWDVTSKCNLKCSHCYSSSSIENKDDEDLTEEDAYRLIDELSDIGVFQLILLGGEPLIRKDIFNIIDYAVKKNLDVGIATNGTIITKEIAKKLSKYNLNGIQVSIDSPQAHIHDEFRSVKGAFHKSIEGIKTLSSEGNRVIVCSVISKINCFEIENIVKIAIDNGAKEFRTIRYIPSGRGLKEFKENAINEHEANHVHGELLRLKEKYEGIIEIASDHSTDFLENEMTQEFCSAGTSTCAIKYNGNVTPCSYINNEKYVCGNVKEESFFDIWHRKTMRDFRDVRKYQGKCKGCNYIQSCKGGCRAAAIGIHEDGYLPDPYCTI